LAWPFPDQLDIREHGNFRKAWMDENVLGSQPVNLEMRE
jgi:hypothetical protein